MATVSQNIVSMRANRALKLPDPESVFCKSISYHYVGVFGLVKAVLHTAIDVLVANNIILAKILAALHFDQD